jgi:hypothetical protein
VVLQAGPPVDQAGRYTRAIVPPPVIVPRTWTFAFRRPAAGTLLDGDGRGTGLTHRLPGTGTKLPARDPNLRLNTAQGQLELTTTDSDLNGQCKLGQGEYLGVRLADLGFTGPEDFAVAVTIPKIPALARTSQFGLYAGTASKQNIRGGVFNHFASGQNTLLLVNNNCGRDFGGHFVGLWSPGDDVRLTLRRTAGKYSLSVKNQTAGQATTLATRHPAFLDGARDLYVGLFGANTHSTARKTLDFKEFQVTVWTTSR